MGTSGDYFRHYRYAGTRPLAFHQGQAFEQVYEAALGAEVADKLGYRLGQKMVIAHGACIHVPPPPANQTVYVKVPKADAQIRNAFDTVWVTGVLSAKPFTSDLATAGYQIEAEEITPYE
jgi:hypothetical protein